MAITVQASFAAGELDPALQERTTFEKYQAGLKTARNIWIGKTGRIINRSGFLYDKKPKYNDRKCIIFGIPFTDYEVEWGHQYVRIHRISTGAYVEAAHDFTEANLPKLQFLPSGPYLYIFLEDNPFKKLVLGDLDPTDPYLDTRFLTTGELIYTPLNPDGINKTADTGNGYAVNYEASFVYGTEESVTTLLGSTGKLPIANGEKVELDIYLNSVDVALYGRPTAVKVYRRPVDGIALGFVGNAVYTGTSGGDDIWHFIDYGGDADYEHQPVGSLPAGGINGVNENFINPKTGAVYQQRLIINEEFNPEALNASRTGYQNNFTRDFPYSDDSALRFRAGSSETAKMLRLLENGGLIAFTTRGIFVHSGALVPANLAMEKKGKWIINDEIPPLEVSGAALMVEKHTNAIRELIYSNEAQGYPGNDIGIFSNHLFENKVVVSWAFQEGIIPIIWVVLNDGSLLSLTYQPEQEMRAWTRHDSDGAFYECVTVVRNFDTPPTAHFVVNRNGNRIIEKTTPRYASNVKDLVFMDSAVTKKELVSSTAKIRVIPDDVSYWNGPLTIESDINVFANTENNGGVGTIFRFFDSQGSTVDLRVTTYTSAKIVKVQPDVEFPSDQAVNVTLYKTYNIITGLDHLNGKFVSILRDGYVEASPYNDTKDGNFPEIMVVNGQIELPAGRRGAITHVGLAYASDVETLDIDSVEQAPTLVESIIMNKLLMKVLNSRGLFVGSQFPQNNYVAGDDNINGMEDIETRKESFDTGNIGNAAQKPTSDRFYLTIPNDWKSQGRVCLRQVDPLPFEILSLIPDLTVLRRR